MCECISCRSGLFAYLARAPFHFSNSHAPTLNLPPTNYCYCCEIFFSQTTCLARYTWRLLVRTSFYLSSIWHRIASFRFRFIANWIALATLYPSLVSYWPLLIYYHVICYLFSRSTEALSISQQSEAAKGASKGLFSVGFALFELWFN